VLRLAVVDDQALLATRQIAASMNVPYTHMAKTIAQLQHLGLVEARRGRGGGLLLTVAGRGVRVGDLIRTLEGEREAVVCGGGTPCPLVGACRLRQALRQAQEANMSLSRAMPARSSVVRTERTSTPGA
jgi:Rrf2 family nitric oxide-sensitive transcriptional repressor